MDVRKLSGNDNIIIQRVKKFAVIVDVFRHIRLDAYQLDIRIASLSFSDSRTKQAVKLSHRSRIEDDTALFCRFEHRLVKAVYVRADVFSEER